MRDCLWVCVYVILLIYHLIFVHRRKMSAAATLIVKRRNWRVSSVKSGRMGRNFQPQCLQWQREQNLSLTVMLLTSNTSIRVTMFWSLWCWLPVFKCWHGSTLGLELCYFCFFFCLVFRSLQYSHHVYRYMNNTGYRYTQIQIIRYTWHCLSYVLHGYDCTKCNAGT